MTTHRTRAQMRIDALQTPSASQLLARLAELEPQVEAARREAAENLADRKSTRLNSSHIQKSRMPSSA